MVRCIHEHNHCNPPPIHHLRLRLLQRAHRAAQLPNVPQLGSLDWAAEVGSARYYVIESMAGWLIDTETTTSDLFIAIQVYKQLIIRQQTEELS